MRHLIEAPQRLAHALGSAVRRERPALPSPEERWNFATTLPQDQQNLFLDREISHLIWRIKKNKIPHGSASYPFTIGIGFGGAVSGGNETVYRIPIDTLPSNTLAPKIRKPLLRHYHDRKRYPQNWGGKPAFGLSLRENGWGNRIELTVDSTDGEGAASMEPSGIIYEDQGRRGIIISSITSPFGKEARTKHRGHASKALDDLSRVVDQMGAFDVAKQLVLTAHHIINTYSQQSPPK